MCWNWQTRWTQNPLVVTPCGFDPRHRHQKEEQGSQELCSSFWLLFDSGVEPKAGAFRKQSCGLFLATGVAAATRYGLRSKTCRPPPLHGRLSRSESTSTPATGKGALAKQDVSTPATGTFPCPGSPARRGVRHGASVRPEPGGDRKISSRQRKREWTFLFTLFIRSCQITKRKSP